VNAAITDTDRINWLEAHPLPVEVRGGPDDGHTARAWGLVAATGTLREAIDATMQASNEPSNGGLLLRPGRGDDAGSREHE